MLYDETYLYFCIAENLMKTICFFFQSKRSCVMMPTSIFAESTGMYNFKERVQKNVKLPFLSRSITPL